MGLGAALVYKVAYQDSYKKGIEKFYSNYTAPKEKVTFDLE